MTLVSAVVRKTLLVLKVLDAAASVPSQGFEDTVADLNRMMTRWEANGLACGWSNVTAPDDTMPSPDEAELAIIYNLAILRANEYDTPSDFGLTVDLAKQYLSELRRDRLVEMPLRSSSDLPCPERGGVWNMYTDGPNRR